MTITPGSNSEKRKTGDSITTIGDFLHAVRGELPELQLYLQHADEAVLIEITEITKVLAKNKDEEPYIVLKCI
ncbi:hypothetical protein LCGC14_1437380 [marine sediment metagenome]|uniref:Uncharacterized protein n=1 Tax=marine sediment metagenome TaxID=412755 RepID=A0A0F9K7Y6_9ZZZZ